MSSMSFGWSFCRAMVVVAVIFVGGCAGFTDTGIDPSSRVNPGQQNASEKVPVPKRRFERVLIIVFENKDEREVIANKFFKELADKGTYFSNFHGLFHPSYSNYLAMVSGRKIETQFDRQQDIAGITTIADLLTSENPKEISWKNYAEGYPADGLCHSKADFIGKYARKHVPFMSFMAHHPNKEVACRNIVPGEQFLIDWKANNLPKYSFYTPDMDHDAHDLPLGDAEIWLKGFLNPLLADAQLMNKTLIVVTFDESAEQSAQGGNHIYTVFLGGMIKAGKKVTSNYNHYNVLRTIEDNFGLRPMADGDGHATPITDAWKDPD